MSVQIMVSAFLLAGLKPTELLVLLALADHAHKNGAGARPSIARLAWKTNLSKSQVEKLMRSLRRRGVIKCVKRGGNGRASEYELDFANAELKEPFKAEKEQSKDDERRTIQPPLNAGNSEDNQPPLRADNSNHSPATSGSNQPPLDAQSPAAGDVPTVNKSLMNPRSAFSLPRSSFPETVKDNVSKTRAREAKQTGIFQNSIRATADAQNRVHQFFCETFQENRKIHKTARRQIKLKFDEGYNETDWKAAIIGCRIAPIDSNENQLNHGFWADILRNFEHYRKIGLSKFEGSAN